MMSQNSITVGQEVAVQSSYSVMFDYTVAKVTPGGQVVAKRTSDGYEMRFDKDGYRMGQMSSRYNRDRLVTNVAAERENARAKTARSAAADAVNAVRGDAGRYNDKESLQAQVTKLAELLEAARVAIEAI